MAAFADLYGAVSPATASALGSSVTSIDGALVLAASRVDVLALNRVVGLGLRSRASDDLLSDVLAALGTAGMPRAFVQVAPSDGHEELEARLAQRGLRHYNNWMRLRRGLADVDSLREPSPPLEVREAGREDAVPFARIVGAAFGYPPPLESLVAAAVGRPGWRHYLACDSGAPIGAGAMYVNGDAAWFGFAATDAAHRRRGVQRALVVQRLLDAAAAGCRWVSVETAEDTITRDAPSFRNLRRLGFEVAYVRPNYLWIRPA